MRAPDASVSRPSVALSSTMARLGLDDLATAVHAQSRAVRVQHGLAADRQAVTRRQPDRADLDAAGVDAPGHGQVAGIQRHIDFTRLQAVADHQVALRAGSCARRTCRRCSARVQRGDSLGVLAQPLRRDVDRAGAERHQRATGIGPAAGRAEQRAAQVDPAGGRVDHARRQRTRLVETRRHIDHAALGLQDVAARTVEQHVPAPAVARQFAEGRARPPASRRERAPSTMSPSASMRMRPLGAASRVSTKTDAPFRPSSAPSPDAVDGAAPSLAVTRSAARRHPDHRAGLARQQGVRISRSPPL